MANNNHSPLATPGAIPRGVWVLGFVSMFMDISSEMIHSLLPLFLVSVMGVGASTPHGRERQQTLDPGGNPLKNECSSARFRP